MPVYHFTFHAYRSWNADHQRGYIQRGENGIKPQNRALGYIRNRLAKQDPVQFDPAEAQFLIDAIKDATARRGWDLYGATVIENHLHAAIGWRATPPDADLVQARLKRALGYLLAKRNGTRGKAYFSRGGLPEQIKTKRHLRFLLSDYFPEHCGAFWRANIE